MAEKRINNQFDRKKMVFIALLKDKKENLFLFVKKDLPFYRQVFWKFSNQRISARSESSACADASDGIG